MLTVRTPVRNLHRSELPSLLARGSSPESGMTPPLELTWGKPGEVVEIRNDVVGRIDPFMLFSPCGAELRSYRCVCCQKTIDTAGDIVLHVSDGGVHHLVTHCTRHVRWEAAEPSQVEAFTAIFGQERAQ